MLSAIAAVAVIVGDQLTKTLAVRHLSDGHIVGVVGPLQFNLSFNSGMAFSTGRGLGPLFGVLAIVIVVALAISMRNGSSKLSTVAVGLVIGGAIGNLLDRMFRAGSGFLGGRVVDFIDLQKWPVFNVADAAIVVGGALVLIRSWRSRPAPEPAP